eukprot:1391449-Amorphochlora_amoeboformis.AAC.1
MASSWVAGWEVNVRVRARIRIRVCIRVRVMRILKFVRVVDSDQDVRVGLGTDYSACLSPRTIDSSTGWDYSAVWDNSRS